MTNRCSDFLFGPSADGRKDRTSLHWAAAPLRGIVALAGNDVRITLDPLSPAGLIRSACTLAERNLTIPEWNAYIEPGIEYRRTCANLPFPAH